MTVFAWFIAANVALSVCRAGEGSPAKSRDIFLDVIVANRFSDGKGMAPSVTVRTRSEAVLDMLIYDMGNGLIGFRSSTNAVSRWELSLQGLPQVPRNIYRFALAASDATGRRVGLYPAEPSGGEKVEVSDSRLDPENGLVKYVLPKAAIVRVRAGFREGAYLAAVLPWEVQPAGPHSVRWDGTSQDGVLKNLSGHPNVDVNVLAISLPANVFVAQNQRVQPVGSTGILKPGALPARVADLASAPWEVMAARTKTATGISIADDYRIVVDVQEDSSARTASVRVDCHPDDRARLLNKRFEIMLFLDRVFVSEDEDGLLPFTYKISTRGVPPGEHFVAINVVDNDGIPGTAVREFVLPPR